MADKGTNGHAGAATALTPLSFEALMDMNRPALNAVAELNNRLYDGLSAMHKEWVGFVNRRLQQDLAVPGQLAGCKTMQDMYSVYAKFYETAFDDYKTELEQFAKLGRSVADETLTLMQHRADGAARTYSSRV